MNTNKIRAFHIAGTIFTILFGSLLHFVYELSGENSFAAVFGAVNESTWEHLKLLFWPIVLFGLIEYFAYGRQVKNFIPAKVLSILIGMLVIMTVFYTYTGILGYNVLALDILTFILGAIAAYGFSYRTITKQTQYDSPPARTASWIGLVILIAIFILFTFNPPEIGLFLDPVTGTYGI
ncbi:MAG: DUF6512 family protein [Eubacteriales bacterium]